MTDASRWTALAMLLALPLFGRLATAHGAEGLDPGEVRATIELWPTGSCSIPPSSIRATGRWRRCTTASSMPAW